MKKITLILLLVFTLSQARSQNFFWSYPQSVQPTITLLSLSPSYTTMGAGYTTTLGTPVATSAGICWNTTGTPTTANSSISVSTTGSSGTLTGLSENTLYYVRAFIVSSLGTFYSNQLTATTLSSASAPTVTTTSASGVSYTTAASGGNVTASGGATVTARGVCWSTSSTPTVADSHTTDGSGTGTFTSSITGLTPSTTYYYRAYATNSAGTGYGSILNFTTNACALASISTTSISGVGYSEAVSGGNISSDGGCSVTARGVCWGTSTNPTISSSHTSDGTGTGAFTSTLLGLTCGTTYYVRAYVTTAAGTAYGSNVSFTTQTNGYPNIPLWNAIAITTCPSGAYNFSSSQALFDQAYAEMVSGCATGLTGFTNKVSDISPAAMPGKQIYEYNSCVLSSRTGYFLYEYPTSGSAPPYGNTWYRLYMINGVVQTLTQLN